MICSTACVCVCIWSCMRYRHHLSINTRYMWALYTLCSCILCVRSNAYIHTTHTHSRARILSHHSCIYSLAFSNSTSFLHSMCSFHLPFPFVCIFMLSMEHTKDPNDPKGRTTTMVTKTTTTTFKILERLRFLLYFLLPL